MKFWQNDKVALEKKNMIILTMIIVLLHLHSKQIRNHSFLMKKYFNFKKVSLLRVFAQQNSKFRRKESCNTEYIHSLCFHSDEWDNIKLTM